VVEDLGNWSYNKLFLYIKKRGWKFENERRANFNYVIFSLIISNFLFDFGGKRD
jgi:hypothetical protein